MAKTVDDLTGELWSAFEKVRDDREYVMQGAELANIAGKMINAQKLRLEYCVLRKETPEIDFFMSAKK